MALPEAEMRTMPRLILGAEVAWAPNLPDIPELPKLCMGRSQNLLLELPFTPWNDQMFRQIYKLMSRTGITPVIAHVERYLKCQKPEHLTELMSLGVPVQVSAEPLLHPLRRSKAVKLLRERKAQLIVSDCHDTVDRPPNLGPGAAVLRQKLGEGSLRAMSRRTDELAARALDL